MEKVRNEIHIILPLLCCLLFFSPSAYSQTFNIKGNISADSIPVRYASITFIDENDTTKKYSAITDTLGNYQLSVIVDVEDKKPIIPQSIELEQNYPNPFLTETTIPYKLKKESDVTVKIHNILGQEVKTFRQGLETTGIYVIRWDGRNNFGIKATPGVYFYQLSTEKERLVKKMLYGLGSSNTGSALINRKELINEETENVKKLQFLEVNYSVKIENTDTTKPPVDVTQLNNITIRSDTTIDIIVNEANDFSLCYQKSSENNSMEIYLNNIKGTHPKDISNWIYEDRTNEWSPNGNYIVFESLGMPTYIRLYYTKKDTIIYLTAGPDNLGAGVPRWTPDSKHIVYSGAGSIYMIEADGSNNRELPYDPDYFYLDSYTFLYQAEGGIYLSNIDGTFNEFVLNPKSIGKNYVGPKDFNPYNHDILILADPTPQITDLLVTYNVDTKKLDTIAVADTGWYYSHPRYSSNYTKIAVLKINYIENIGKLCILENGTETDLVTINNYGEEMFSFYPLSFSPDDKYLAYSKSTYVGDGGWYNYLHVIELATKKITFIDIGAGAKWNPLKEH